MPSQPTTPTLARRAGHGCALTSVLALLALAGCGDDDGRASKEARTTGGQGAGVSTTAAKPTSGPTTTTPVSAAQDAPCSKPGQTRIPAVEIPAVRAAAVTVPDQKLGGQTVPGFTVRGVDIPARRIPAQCVTVAPAPAGCLGRVVIPASSIPAASIPAARIPGVHDADADQDEIVQDAVSNSEVLQPAVSQPGLCREKVEPGEFQASVFRPSVFRPSVFRASVFRPSLFRPSVCAGSDCIPSVTVPSVTVASVTVDSVNVPSATLESRTLPKTDPKCVRVLSSDDATAYSLCADVLFAFDSARVRSRAATALKAVGDALRDGDGSDSGSGSIRVDGHTDARGDGGYNQRLSLRRAEAVRRWLVDHSGFERSRIAVRGYGESQPVASNDGGAGRRRNRRVVIGVGR